MYYYYYLAEKKGFEEKEKAEQDVINERKKELDRIAQEKLQQEVRPSFSFFFPSFIIPQYSFHSFSLP